jgi:uncharacterized protein (DUF427 family)
VKRPDLQPGQEWVWEYPRPPRLERSERLVRVEFAGIEIARTTRALRILETSHPPVYYIPPGDVAMDLLQAARGTTFCEWKGTASYYDIEAGDRTSPRAAWTYHHPDRRYAELRDHLAFYPSRVDACYVGDERVLAQEGDFYGGWITPEIVGPFKGGAGTFGW